MDIRVSPRLTNEGAQPDIWPKDRFPIDYPAKHMRQSPTTPFAIPEFQGGSGTSWY
jgi:hypothetical protein